MFMQKLQRAVALHQQGMLNEASDAYQRLLKENPREVNVLNFLGVLCFQQGRHQEGIKYLKKCLQIKPNFAQAHNNLGNGYMQAEMLKDAVQCFSRAVALTPDYAEAHHNLATAYGKQKDFDLALLHAKNAVQFAPRFAPGWAALASIHFGRKDFSEALAAVERAELLSPGLPEAALVRARVLWGQEKYLDAIALYRTVIGRLNDDKAVLREFGACLMDTGRPDEALPHLQRLVERAPDDGLGMALLGSALKALGELERAEPILRKAAALAPDSADAQRYLSLLLQAMGQYQEAESVLKRAIAIAPKSKALATQLVELLFEMDRQSEGFSLLKCLLGEYPDDTGLLSLMLAYSNYSAEYSAECRLQMALDYGELVSTRAEMAISNWQVDPQPERLRIGLVSGDILEHPVGYFLQNVLPKIDQSRIELIAYPTQRAIDCLSQRLMPYMSAWKQIGGVSDECAADMICSDGVHILIDLSGHTKENRLSLFARKPAPVQASWLGYFATTGVKEIDYFIVDEAGAPPSMQDQFCERLWYLPDTRMCSSPPDLALEVGALPALKNGYVTFGSFQNLKKLQMPVLKVWAKIISGLPGSRLRLQSQQFSDPAVMAAFGQRFEAAGGDLSRLELHGPARRATYLEAHREVDVILDTFPFPGGTTTCDALWMGVPTLTLAGGSLIARQGVSMLTAAGLSDWIAEDETVYVKKALIFASDLAALSALRLSLREQVANSALFDGDRFARNFEEALFGMWQARAERVSGT